MLTDFVSRTFVVSPVIKEISALKIETWLIFHFVLVSITDRLWPRASPDNLITYMTCFYQSRKSGIVLTFCCSELTLPIHALTARIENLDFPIVLDFRLSTEVSIMNRKIWTAFKQETKKLGILLNYLFLMVHKIIQFENYTDYIPVSDWKKTDRGKMLQLRCLVSLFSVIRSRIRNL